MASGSFSLGVSGRLEGKIDWSSSSNGSIANSSSVTARLYARRTNSDTTYGKDWSGYVRIGSSQVNVGFDSSVYVSSSWVLMASVSSTVGHSDSGVGSVVISGSVSGPVGTSLAGNTVGASKTVSLDTIPRYASISHKLSSRGLDGFKVSWSSDCVCDLLEYKLNGGSWVKVSGNPYSVSGLKPNVMYKVKTRVRRADSKLWSETGDMSVTTFDIARITELKDFEHGLGVKCDVSNPSRF